MIVSEKHKFIFIDIPKAGTHSVENILLPLYDAERIGIRRSDADIPPWYRRLGYYVFGVVRNPFSRTLSAWWHLCFREPYYKDWRPIIGSCEIIDFVKWLAKDNIPYVPGNVVLTPQCVYEDVAGGFDAAIHLENIDKEIQALPFWKGPNHIPRLLSDGTPSNNSRYGDWKLRMTDEIAGVILDIYGEDFDRYGYDRNWRATGRPVVVCLGPMDT
jgi:hypothetical protein